MERQLHLYCRRYWFDPSNQCGSVRFVKNALLAQSVERKPFKLVVVGSIPTQGIFPI